MGSFFDLNFTGVKKVFNIRFFIVIILMIATIFITIGWTRASYQCPPKEIKYIFVPRTFEEQQDQPYPVSEIFQKLFDEPSPWLSSFVGSESTQPTSFVSQSETTYDF